MHRVRAGGQDECGSSGGGQRRDDVAVSSDCQLRRSTPAANSDGRLGGNPTRWQHGFVMNLPFLCKPWCRGSELDGNRSCRHERGSTFGSRSVRGHTGIRTRPSETNWRSTLAVNWYLPVVNSDGALPIGVGTNRTCVAAELTAGVDRPNRPPVLTHHPNSNNHVSCKSIAPSTPQAQSRVCLQRSLVTDRETVAPIRTRNAPAADARTAPTTNALHLASNVMATSWERSSSAPTPHTRGTRTSLPPRPTKWPTKSPRRAGVAPRK